VDVRNFREMILRLCAELREREREEAHFQSFFLTKARESFHYREWEKLVQRGFFAISLVASTLNLRKLVALRPLTHDFVSQSNFDDTRLRQTFNSTFFLW
jgi:hypothetical protein